MGLFLSCPQGFVVDFTDPELADVALALEYLNANEHGVSVIPVKDMATIPHFAENYFLSEGRLLTLEDDAARNKVCVVHQGLADRRNLKVGDTLTITIKDLEMYHWGQTYPDWEPNLAGAPEVTESYTIVGTVYSLQKNTDSMQYSEIYIPNCFYPAHFRQTVWAGSCGFVLRNPADKAAFWKNLGHSCRSWASGQNLWMTDGTRFMIPPRRFCKPRAIVLCCWACCWC